MIGVLVSLLKPLLKLDEPAPEGMTQVPGARVFRASPRYVRYLYARAMLTSLSVVVPWLGASVALGVATSRGEVPLSVTLLVAFGYGTVVLAGLGFAFVCVELDYHFRVYAASSQSLRRRSGVWEQIDATLTFANVQNVRVEQGPLERAFGIASVVVDTAGGAKAGAAASAPILLEMRALAREIADSLR